MAHLFDLGRLVITAHAQDVLAPEDVVLAIGRHSTGDWGDLDPEDAKENELSVREGFRVLSSYADRNGNTFWLITEADRSSTCVLLPEDY